MRRGNFFNFVACSWYLLAAIACSKDPEEKVPDSELPIEKKWSFTRLVNVISEDGFVVYMDFYQKKDNKWRIVRMEADDYATFFFKDTITPAAYQLPISDSNAYMTSDISGSKLFSTSNNLIYYPNNVKVIKNNPPEYNANRVFSSTFPDMPSKWSDSKLFQGATVSFEYPYDLSTQQMTYIFYDFKNQKYVYYGFKTGADLVIDSYTLPQLCTGCDKIDWKSIDAVTCTYSRLDSDLYYFFDFDGNKIYILTRESKNTSNPKFILSHTVSEFATSFKNRYGSNGGNELPFDFTK